MSDYQACCDRCGLVYMASTMKLTWNGLRVCPDDFERQHPQEFIRGRQPDRIGYGSLDLGPVTFLAANAVSAEDL
jgi:hypothetical protein